MGAPDWTHGAAKWGAALLLGAASLGGMAWSLAGRKPAPVHTQGVERRNQTPAPKPVAPPPAAAAKPLATNDPPARVETAPPAAPVNAGPHKVNLNTATQAELELLPGIGPAMATRILEYRAAHGRFATIEQLDSVKGIGPRTLAKLRPLVSVE